jgi:hypothetical protein
MYKFTSLLTKHRQLACQVGGRSRTLLIEKEAMAPCTYVGLALGAAPISRIRCGSLKFIDANGPTLAFSLLPRQVLRFGDLDFIADHLKVLVWFCRIDEILCANLFDQV